MFMMILAAGLSTLCVYNEYGWSFSTSQGLTSYGHPSPDINQDYCKLSFSLVDIRYTIHAKSSLPVTQVLRA